VTLYAAGNLSAEMLASAFSGDEGNFTIRWRRPPANPVIYVVATRGSGITLMAVLGTVDSAPSSVVVNELTTVASVWTSAQFLDGVELSGNAVGLASAAANVPNLVDLSTGGLGDVVQNGANLPTTVLATLNSLATILSDCVVTGSCGDFYLTATPPGEPVPSDTLQALLNVALNPWNNVGALFDLVPRPSDDPTFVPTLLFPPTGWTLSLVYTGGGLDAPGGISIDAEGNVWTNNNFIPGSQSNLLGEDEPLPSFSGTGLTKLRSNGEPISPPSGFLGGGLFGAAFGMAIDQDGHAWVGNFTGSSLSEFAPDGTPISPDSVPTFSATGGYQNPPALDNPQSVVVDQGGSIWVTNIGNNTVTQLVGGDPMNVRTAGGGDCAFGFDSPWGMAVDHDGSIWVTNLRGASVSRLDPSTDPLCPGPQIPVTDISPATPQGVAVDSQGNIWTSNSDVSSVSLLRPPDYGPAQVFKGGISIRGPFGIAIDGADNVWVPNYAGQSLVNLCGVAEDCPVGFETGDAISPFPTGYGGGGGLQRLTSVVIDQAGNVWVANNNNLTTVCFGEEGVTRDPPGITDVATEALSTQCGGNGVVVFFGIAAPVAAPLIGPPVQP
jgi:sugar lactone lactonase YvrE